MIDTLRALAFKDLATARNAVRAAIRRTETLSRAGISVLAAFGLLYLLLVVAQIHAASAGPPAADSGFAVLCARAFGLGLIVVAALAWPPMRSRALDARAWPTSFLDRGGLHVYAVAADVVKVTAMFAPVVLISLVAIAPQSTVFSSVLYAISILEALAVLMLVRETLQVRPGWWWRLTTAVIGAFVVGITPRVAATLGASALAAHAQLAPLAGFVVFTCLVAVFAYAVVVTAARRPGAPAAARAPVVRREIVSAARAASAHRALPATAFTAGPIAALYVAEAIRNRSLKIRVVAEAAFAFVLAAAIETLSRAGQQQAATALVFTAVNAYLIYVSIVAASSTPSMRDPLWRCAFRSSFSSVATVTSFGAAVLFAGPVAGAALVLIALGQMSAFGWLASFFVVVSYVVVALHLCLALRSRDVPSPVALRVIVAYAAVILPLAAAAWLDAGWNSALLGAAGLLVTAALEIACLTIVTWRRTRAGYVTRVLRAVR